MAIPRTLAEEHERKMLEPFALKSADSLGRRHPEPDDPHRTAFARDRDRVVHSGAFRRLEYKTQVLLSGTGDHYRTRLTHSLEVAQIARSQARALGLNESLVETLALAHDLGHPPFGHSGEAELRELMAAGGGFEHNIQALRIVDFLECPYPDRPGLNLTLETRESILKHGPEKAGPLGAEFERRCQPWLEAQLVDLADSLAYLAHDLDDGMRFGVLTRAELEPIELWQVAQEGASRRYPGADPSDLLRPTLQQVLHLPILDLIGETERRLAEAQIGTPDEARDQPQRLVSFTDDMRRMQSELKKFLFERFYRAEQVVKVRAECRRILRELFSFLAEHPEEIPTLPTPGEDEDLTRRVCDYVAGMTDRFATSEHDRLLG